MISPLAERAARLKKVAATAPAKKVEEPKKPVNRLRGASPLGSRALKITEKAAKKDETSTAPAPSQADDKDKLLLDSLETDCAKLSDIAQGTDRLEAKWKYVEQYLPYIEDFLAEVEEDESKIRQYPVLTQVMVWAFDCQEMKLFVRLAKASLQYGQELHCFKKNIKTFIADCIFEYTETLYKAEDVDDEEWKFALELFSEYYDQVLDWQVPDILKARFCKLRGLFFFDGSKWQEAVKYLEEAQDWGGDKIGVKTDLKKAKAKLEAAKA